MAEELSCIVEAPDKLAGDEIVDCCVVFNAVTTWPEDN